MYTPFLIGFNHMDHMRISGTEPSSVILSKKRNFRSCCCFGEWEGGPVNQVNHTSWVAVVTPTDRPKSVRNCCLIELFCSVVCVFTLTF